MTEKLSARKLRERRREQILRAYEKNRRRNLLAKPGIHEFVIVLDRLKAGYNVPKIFRSAEAFGAHEVQLIDIGPFDPSPAKGAFRQVPARFFADFSQSHKNLQERGYHLYALSPDSDRTLDQEALPDKSAFVFGHEETGLSFTPEEYPDIRLLRIPQFGRVESLNVSIAASIVMYEYTRQRQP
ncbi:TrmH family RNA methyltransferase [Thiolapillus sp.]